jgi:arginase
MKQIELIEITSEIGAGTRGSSMGVQALKIASLNEKSTYFRKYPISKTPNTNEVLLTDNKYPYAKHIDSVYENLHKVADLVSKTGSKAKETFPIILSADHSSAYGTIAGIKKSLPNKRLGVIWIDAHADLHTPYTTPSGNMHGMPLAMALYEDNKICQVNQPEKETLDYWSKIKNIGTDTAKILAEDLVFIGLRSTEAAEESLIEKGNIRTIRTREVNRKGVLKIVDEVFEHLSECDLIYISFDVDSTDSRFSAGTGTPEKYGLSPDQALQLNTNLVQNPKVICWEMAEINPTLDTKNNMATYGFEVLQQVTKVLEQR